ncbi:carbohydrate ABC transporter substrate-binding protein [Clostridium sp. P21]|uniref:Carbohydrate ABC transporter substrate-binding protein n=1 Tax=Clostridium muellerianum TaxID=2716538 RepID=A0A7Y0HP13_9CLOT|nr:carbohydrate ABC transporter substrate-binding protein [Clostridium muellerianum]
MACNKSKDLEKEKQLNVYVDLKDKESSSILKSAIEEYKKDNAKVKVSVNNVIGGKIEDDIAKNVNADVIVTSRSNMIKLSRKGLLSDIGNFYDENKFSDRYYTVVNAYGRFNDKYYGIGLIPYTMEVLYNEDSFKKLNLKVPSNMDELKIILKSLNDMSIRVPVIITESLDINSALASMIINNKVSMGKLESKYDSGAEFYKSLNEMQQAFNDISTFVKKNNINKNTFEIGNDSSINKFVKGDIPLIISSSYYFKDFKSENIKVVDNSLNGGSSKINVPVICNSIICVPVNSKNSEETNSFIKFIVSDNFQKKLVGEGLVSGNKKVNSSIKSGVKSAVVKHLQESTENNIIFVENIPERLKSAISSKMDEMLSGKQSTKMWEDIVNEAYR